MNPVPDPSALPPQQPVYQQTNGALVLILGILSVIPCLSILGPISLILGSPIRKAIDAGRADPDQRSQVQIGSICGIIGSVWLVLSVAICIGWGIWAIHAAMTAPPPPQATSPLPPTPPTTTAPDNGYSGAPGSDNNAARGGGPTTINSPPPPGNTGGSTGPGAPNAFTMGDKSPSR